MRRLSEILKTNGAPLLESGEVLSWQGLLLFDDGHILDKDKILSSQEIEKLLIYFYGQPRCSEVRTDSLLELQDWLNDQMYKAEVNDRAMVYPVKTPFEELTVDGYQEGGEFSGPLNIMIFKPDVPVENEFLVLTCRWQGELLLNNNYIIGVIADTDDLVSIIFEYLRRD
jgi:hypothetical protein